MMAVILFIPLLLFACGQQKESAEKPADTPAQEATLTGKVWKWQNLTTATEEIEVSVPDDYTLEFLADSKAAMKADCNRGTASYQVNDQEIQFGPIASTRAMCPEGSLSEQYLMYLEAAATFRIDGDALFIELKEGAGRMEFSGSE
jgi:heat shock protein HslJ